MTVESAAQIVGDTKIVIIRDGKRLGGMTNAQIQKSGAFSDVEIKRITQTRKAMHFHV